MQMPWFKDHDGKYIYFFKCPEGTEHAGGTAGITRQSYLQRSSHTESPYLSHDFLAQHVVAVSE